MRALSERGTEAPAGSWRAFRSLGAVGDVISGAGWRPLPAALRGLGERVHLGAVARSCSKPFAWQKRTVMKTSPGSVCESASAAAVRSIGLGGLNNQNLFSHSLGGQKSKSRCPRGGLLRRILSLA